MLAASLDAERSLGVHHRDEIEALVGRGMIDEALKHLQDCVRDLAPGLKRDTLLLCARYHEFKSARRRGLVKSIETDSAIVDSLLQLASDAVETGAIQPHLKLAGPSEVPSRDAGTPVQRSSFTASVHQLGTFDDTGPGTVGTIHRLPTQIVERLHPDRSGTLSDFRKSYWRQYRDASPPERSVICIAENISRGYRGSPFVLDKLSFSLRAGEITGVVGRNAAGKTTLLRMILGELAPHVGRVSYPALAVGVSNWAYIKSQIAYLPQLPSRWPGRLRENLNFAASIAGVKGRANKEVVEWNMQRYGLVEYSMARWDEISGGYKIRFELAKALVSKPRLLVLDEPLAYLDIAGRQEFLLNLAAIATSFEQPVPIIITSQHLYEIEAIADQMIILDGGHCRYSGALSGVETLVPNKRIELTVRSSSKAVETSLAPFGLLAIEPTMDGFIVDFPKATSTAALFENLSRALGDQLLAVRDITGSARSLFKDEADFPAGKVS